MMKLTYGSQYFTHDALNMFRKKKHNSHTRFVVVTMC